MPKVNVYLPDRLATAVREAGLPVSAICQRALEETLRRISKAETTNRVWLTGSLTKRAWQALELSVRAAAAWGSETVEPEHVLLGILEQGDNFAVFILEHLGARPEEVREALEARLVRSDLGPPSQDLDEALSPEARRALITADEEAARLGHNYLGNEHFLLGLLLAEGSLSAEVLGDAGVTPDALRKAMAQLLKTWVSSDPRKPRSPAGAEPGEQPAPEAADEPLVQSVLKRLDAIEARLGPAPG